MANKLTLSEFLQSSTDESTDSPSLPTLDELRLLRNGLRKKTIPDISLLPTEFEYEAVGEFKKQSIGSDISLAWKTANGVAKMFSFIDLCTEVAHELDRLEFGWMIANFARLDGLKYLSQMRPISYEDHHQNQFNKQYAEQEKHFQKIENDWRHWAIVPAGHMLMAEKKAARRGVLGNSPEA